MSANDSFLKGQPLQAAPRVIQPPERPAADGALRREASVPDYPLSILDHRISALQDRLARMSEDAARLTGEAHATLSAKIEAEKRELEGMISERKILAADAR
jgi:hypothetical protein